jgi:hypothetical protein
MDRGRMLPFAVQQCRRDYCLLFLSITTAETAESFRQKYGFEEIVFVGGNMSRSSRSRSHQTLDSSPVMLPISWRDRLQTLAIDDWRLMIGDWRLNSSNLLARSATRLEAGGGVGLECGAGCVLGVFDGLDGVFV